MNLDTQRRCLSLLAAALLVGSTGFIAWSLSDVGEIAAKAEVGNADLKLSQAVEPIQSPIEDFSGMSLRQPLYDPPPQPAKPTPRAAPPIARQPKQPSIDVTLVGTIIQSDDRLAILADAAGNFDVKGIGDSLELEPIGMTIEEIESESVTLQWNDRQSVIRLDRSAKRQDRERKRNTTDDARPAGNRRRNRQ